MCVPFPLFTETLVANASVACILSTSDAFLILLGGYSVTPLYPTPATISTILASYLNATILQAVANLSLELNK